MISHKMSPRTHHNYCNKITEKYKSKIILTNEYLECDLQMCGRYIFLSTNSDVKGTLKQTSSSTKIKIKVMGVNWATGLITWQI